MRRAALLLAFSALLAGCATTGSGSGSGGGSVPPPVTTSAPSKPAAPPTSAAPPTNGEVTVDGVVEKGVEPGCLVLKTASESYLLEGARASSVPLAVPVRVSGEVRADLLSYCQQGTPLEVTAATRR